LADDEIRFLSEWLDANEAIATSWPADVVYARIRAVLADGTITEIEREHLVTTLQQFVGGTPEQLAAPQHVTELAFDDVPRVEFPGCTFCLTGEFVFAPRDVCAVEIEKRGGTVGNVTKRLRYLVVGGLGSKEWKHGSFGNKIEKAMKYKRDGAAILIVREDQWAASL
jgi:NAD-dependent DNA ligase